MVVQKKSENGKKTQKMVYNIENGWIAWRIYWVWIIWPLFAGENSQPKMDFFPFFSKPHSVCLFEQSDQRVCWSAHKVGNVRINLRSPHLNAKMSFFSGLLDHHLKKDPIRKISTHQETQTHGCCPQWVCLIIKFFGLRGPLVDSEIVWKQVQTLHVKVHSQGFERLNFSLSPLKNRHQIELFWKSSSQIRDPLWNFFFPERGGH